MKARLKKNKSIPQKSATDRRAFIKKLGMGIIATSAYTVISITPFACKHDPIEPTLRGGY